MRLGRRPLVHSSFCTPCRPVGLEPGFLDVDIDGREVPLPDDASLVGRWFEGKMLFVT